MQIKRCQAIQIKKFTSIKQCKTWEKSILENGHEWLNRFPGFFSYGNAWYLDIEAGNLNYYHTFARETNKLIQSTLPGFKKTLLNVAQYLVAPGNKTNLPVRARRKNIGPYWCDCGVHIFKGKTNKLIEMGTVHADYEGLSPYPKLLFLKTTTAFSAILSIATNEGGGLTVWKERRLGNESSDLKGVPYEHFEYSPGSLTVLDSFFYHKINACKSTKEKPWRMTGVMHFLYLKEPYPHWEYWF